VAALLATGDAGAYNVKVKVAVWPAKRKSVYYTVNM